ncbi:RsiV family protein [Mycobacterium sp. Aquia_216]|uniref:esterase n=1 Tax=Mycobacterium sp. Aquia_216 TaxID=2991729 RepID=UPI00227B636E|nr:esterase [Mycobacterium sp. Aquia_216]WAJ46761.1 RsiV family protein [Mycobacterium sp. Aquia_216]
MRYLIAAAVLLTAVLLARPAAAGPPTCASLGGAVEGGQLCQVRATGPTYTLNMTFPADYPDQQLTDYITQNRDGFLAVAQTTGPRDQPYQMEATTEQHFAGQPPHNTRSVVLKFFQDVGGSHTSTWYKAFNYNLATKQPITFDNLFVPNTSPLEAIFPLVQRDLERQNALGAAILPSSGRDPSHYQNFAITEDQLIFYFAPGEMLPAFAGPCQAQVPRNAIPPLAV